MPDCCDPKSIPDTRADNCPACDTRGTSVDLRTVKAVLTESALGRLDCVGHRFCRTASCDVVYYDELGTTYGRRDIRVRVWQKEQPGDRTICYCFGETESTIRDELRRGGSTVLVRINAHIEAGRCACDVRNPRGVCCLGDIQAAVQRMSTQCSPAGEAL